MQMEKEPVELGVCDLGEACLMGEAPEGRGGIQRDEPWTSLGGFLHWNRRKLGRLGTGQVIPQVWWLTCRDFLCDDFYFLCEEEQS